MAIDPFDEFEFKPLTEGLGFHKNSESNANAHSTTSMMNEPTAPKGFPLIKKPKIEFALNNMETEIISDPIMPMAPTMPTAKPATGITQKIKQNNKSNTTTVDDILKTLGERKKYDFTEDIKLTEKTDSVLKHSHFELAAALLDGMLIVASFLTSLIILLVVTKVDLFGNLLTPDDDGMVYYGLAALFGSLCWTYLVVNRIFLGFTPGEWVFDQRLGNPEQLGTAEYSIRVAVRATITVVTGLVVLPIISMLTRKDLLGKALRVQMMKKA